MQASTRHVPGSSDISAEPNPATPYGPVRSLVVRAPLVSFLILSCLLSWWPAVLLATGVPSPPIAGFGPFLAAVVVLGMTQGRAGIGRLLRSMVQWRVPRRAYLVGIGLPLLVSGSAIGVTLALGAARPDAADVALWTTLPIVVLLKLLIPGAGGAWEEPGFRGFALGRFEERFGASAGPLVLGVFWVFWHLPLFVTGDILWTDVLEVVAASVVIAALFHSARDSVLIAMLFHATNNTIGGEFASGLFHGSDATTLGMLTAAGWWLVAGGILVRRHRGRDRYALTVGEPS
jgi:membrane protease YdiL (CAAX protease family)